MKVTAPPVIPDYTTYMRGVDLGDQLIQLYNVGRRSRKWWKRVLFYLLEVAILNAYVIERAYREDHLLRGHAKRDLLSFRLELAEQLIGDHHGRKRSGRHPKPT